MALLSDRDEGQHESAGWAGYAGLPDPLPEIPPADVAQMLIIGSQPTADSIARWSERAGLRCAGIIPVGEVAARLTQTVELALLLLDLRGVSLPHVLKRGSIQALTARYDLARTRLVVIVDLDELDCAMALLDAPRTEFLCEPSDSDIVSLLVMAGLNMSPHGANLHDASRDTEMQRIERLSDEVRRLAETIERMTTGGAPGLPNLVPDPPSAARDRRDAYRVDRGDSAADPARVFQPRERHRAPEAGGGEPTHAEMRALIRARRMRDQYLPADLFADPAWDMILDLMAARLAGQRVSVSSLCIAASVPPTTALRWIRQLTDRGVFARIDDPADGRRVFIELTDAAADAVLGWAQAVRRNGGMLCGVR